VNAAGTLLWQKCWGGTEMDECRKIIPTTSNTFLVINKIASTDGDFSNVTFPYPFSKCCNVLEIDANGTILKNKIIRSENESLGAYFDPNDIISSAEGGYIISGAYCFDLPFGSDFWVAKLDSHLNVTWQKTFGGASADNNAAISQSSDGKYWISGITCSREGDVGSNYGNNDLWVARLNAQGSIEFSKTFGGSYGESFAFTTVSPVVHANDHSKWIGVQTYSFDCDAISNHSTDSPDYLIVKIQ